MSNEKLLVTLTGDLIVFESKINRLRLQVQDLIDEIEEAQSVLSGMRAFVAYEKTKNTDIIGNT